MMVCDAGRSRAGGADGRRAARARAYARLWSATMLSNLGGGIRMAALPLLVAALTADPVAVAGVTVAGRLPWLLFGLFAGAIV